MKSPRQKFLELVAAAMPQLNIRNIKTFSHRVAVEIDVMRGRIFDHLRDHVVSDDRRKKLSLANDALYRAHVALLEAQAELSK